MAALTRADLAEAVHEEVGLSRVEAARFVDEVMGEIAGCLARGEPVKLSLFGRFESRDRRPGIARNPKTGELAPIAARRVVRFRPSPILSERINGALSDGGKDS